MNSIRVWDLPLRLFHWLLVVCVAGAYFCVKSAGVTEGWLSETGLDWMTWHSRFGYAVLTLILFRLIWGVVGPYYARFTQFVVGPRRIAAYLRATTRTVGHNPLGAWSVLAMLLAFGVQAASGLFASDDILFEGPLSDTDPALSRFLNSVHHTSEWVLIALVALHLCAIVYYSVFRRQPMIRAMVTGDLPVERLADAKMPARSQDNAATATLAAIVLLVCAAFVFWLSQF
ncbi:MAG TPA: cytochrome b/b6 domain-containing protein [Advenella sp.]|nr:cytochrome b/b6 domain-containing protein [Advenella sp.]